MTQSLEPIKVLFVCLGNICRSPMAEGIFIHLVKEAGLEDKIIADSAGTGDWHIGSPAHHGTRRVLRDNGIEYDGRGRLFVRDDLDEFDYIATMDDDNFKVVNAHGKGKARVEPLLSHAPHLKMSEVPDPYFSGGFDGVYILVQAGAQALLDKIREENNL